MDYTSNTNKDKEEQPRPEKNIEKVITGDVVEKPRSVGRKFRNIFFGGNLTVAMKYVAGDILLPAARNMVVDVGRGTLERWVYGESPRSRRPPEYGSRIQYNRPVYRSPLYHDPREPVHLPDQRPRYRSDGRRDPNDIVLASREEAELVVERLMDIVQQYESASLADLYELLGLPSSPVDNKWGWTYLSNLEIRQIRTGYLIELPSMEAL